MFHHLDRFGNLVNVAGHADHIQHAVFEREDVVLPIALAARIRHGGEFQPSRFESVISDNPAHVCFFAMPPGAEFRFWKLGGIVFIADLHVIDACCDAGQIDRPHLFVGELGIVDEAAVTDRAIEHFQFRPVGNPRRFIGHGRDRAEERGAWQVLDFRET